MNIESMNIENIRVINPNTNTIYVRNSDSNSISVIDGKSNTLVRILAIGGGAMVVDLEKNIVYVAGTKGVFAIDSLTNKLAAGVIFSVSPFNTGHIICNNAEVPTNQYVDIIAGTHCIAQNNNGYQFTSWIENLGQNSTKNITPVKETGLFYTVVNWLKSIAAAFGLKMFQDDTSATLNVTKFGSFTANFDKVPPPLPPEYWASLFSVVATALIGSLLIPAIVERFRSKKQTSRLNSYHQHMNSLIKDGLNEKDINALNELNQNISDDYSKGKIINEQYANLKKEISILYEEIYKKEIDSLKESSEVEDGRPEIKLQRIHENVMDAHSKDRINNEHYTDIKNEISIAYKKIFNERIMSGAVEIDEIREYIAEAYSDNKITEKHLSNNIFSKSDNNSSDPLIMDRRSMTQAKKAHVVHASLILGVLQHVPSVLYYSSKIACLLCVHAISYDYYLIRVMLL